MKNSQPKEKKKDVEKGMVKDYMRVGGERKMQRAER